MSEIKGGRLLSRVMTRCKPVYLDYFLLCSINKVFSTCSLHILTMSEHLTQGVLLLTAGYPVHGMGVSVKHRQQLEERVVYDFVLRRTLPDVDFNFLLFSFRFLNIYLLTSCAEIFSETFSSQFLCGGRTCCTVKPL